MFNEDFDDTVIFEVEGQEWTWGEAFRGARARGDLAGAEVQTRAGLARQWAGDPPEEAWKAEARSFRVENGLGAARDMLGWLAAVGLDANAWMDALARRMFAGRSVPPGWPEPDPDELALALRADLAVMGLLPSVARSLADRVAVAAGVGVSPPQEAGPDARIGAVEQAWTRRVEQIASVDAVAAFLRANRTDWIAVRLVFALFTTAEAAREAAMCVTQDGLELAAVAHEARAATYGRSARLRELDPELRSRLLGVRPGELVGPVERPDGFVLALVQQKTLPSAEDPATRAACRDLLMRPLAAAAVAERVQWRVKL